MAIFVDGEQAGHQGVEHVELVYKRESVIATHEIVPYGFVRKNTEFTISSLRFRKIFF